MEFVGLEFASHLARFDPDNPEAEEIKDRRSGDLSAHDPLHEIDAAQRARGLRADRGITPGNSPYGRRRAVFVAVCFRHLTRPARQSSLVSPTGRSALAPSERISSRIDSHNLVRFQPAAHMKKSLLSHVCRECVAQGDRRLSMRVRMRGMHYIPSSGALPRPGSATHTAAKSYALSADCRGGSTIQALSGCALRQHRIPRSAFRGHVEGDREPVPEAVVPEVVESRRNLTYPLAIAKSVDWIRWTPA